MYVSGQLDTALAKLGNQPGDHQGKCMLLLSDGTRLGELASGSVTCHAEGVTGRLDDGRGFFLHNSGAMIIDLPWKDAPAR